MSGQNLVTQVPQQNELFVGMPKSGKPWKKLSTKSSSRNKRFNNASWEVKSKQRKQKKELQQYLKDFEAEKFQKTQKEKAQRKNKKKIDELNKFKTANLQIIKDSKNIKKWTKKARQTLIKLPSEIFEKLLKTQRNI